MANWCNNIVTFEGDSEKLKSINILFQQMREKEKAEECGQLPDFVKGDVYFFDIIQEDENESIFQYGTKWTPNIKAIQQIADHFGVEFIHEYEELGFLIYGRAIYTNGTLTEYDLEDEDFDKYEFNEEECTYTFADDIYQSEFDILEILLEDKINEKIA